MIHIYDLIGTTLEVIMIKDQKFFYNILTMDEHRNKILLKKCMR